MRLLRTPRLLALLPAAALAAGAACTPVPRSASASAGADTLALAERRAIPGLLAFVSERDGDREVYLVRPSGEGERRLTHSPLDEYNYPASPDGALLVVGQVREDSTGLETRLWLHPVGGGPARPLGPRAERLLSPAWSPDGSWLVFESDSASFRDLYRIGRDGRGLARLTDDPQGNFHPAVAPDGSGIVFLSSRDMVAELYHVRPDGTGERRLTRTLRDEWTPRWSGSGRRVAFGSDRDGSDRIYVAPAAGGPARRVSAEPPDVHLVEEDPVWSPTGERLAYVVRRRGEKARIRLVDFATGWTGEVRSEPGASDDEPAWSPDGRWLAFSSTRGGDPELYLARADGGAPTRVTRSPGLDWHPDWVPAPRHGARPGLSKSR